MSHHTIAAGQLWLLAALVGFMVAAHGADVRAPSGGAWASEIMELRRSSLFLQIARQNLTVLCLLIAGALSFGIITGVVLLLNGALIGAEIAVAVWGGVAVWELVAVLLPHGVLEMGALLIAGGLGLRNPWKYVRAPREALCRAPEMARRLLGLGLIIVMAAAIEAWVTLPLAEEIVRARS